MSDYDEPALVLALSKLPGTSRIAFACACASRLVQPYRNALEELGAESTDLVTPALDTLWAYVAGGAQADWVTLTDRLIGAIPDEGEITSAAHRALDDTLAATAYAARTAATNDAQEAAYAARRAYEAVDAFAQQALTFTVYTPEVDQEVSRHPFVLREMERQRRDLSDLQASLPVEVFKVRALEEDALSSLG
jgi:hypothetical protein